MNRSWVIWSIALVCALLVLIGMGVMSARVLDAESKRIEADIRADEMERIRLALWRLETGATAVLVAENQRLPEEYRSYYTPRSLWSAEQKQIEVGGLRQPSPLLGVPSDPVLLHFEVDENGVLISPEVPEGADRLLAVKSDLANQWLMTGEERLGRLRDLLGVSERHRKTDKVFEQEIKKISKRNLDVLRNAARADDLEVKSRSLKDVKTSFSKKGKEKQEDKTRFIKSKEDLDVYLDQRNRVILNENVGKQQALAKNDLKRLGKPAEGSVDYELLSETSTIESLVGNKKDREGQRFESDQTVTSSSLPFQSLWVDGQLILIREVYIGQVKKLQGVWLDSDKFKKELLGTVSDLLPEADLFPVARFSIGTDSRGVFEMKALPVEENPMSLVSFPWLLDSGRFAPSKAYKRLAFKPLLGAWLATLFGLVAVAGLLAGVMKLSARRAAFVSAVTHELRTPLTTFKLYSEMLAEGMVPNEKIRKEYLGTLRKEADRLSHLVENVLAYSKVERGSARAQLREERIGNHVAAMEPRLRDRIKEEGASFILALDEEASGKTLKVDFTALEQIMFNLVDNACKYGCDNEAPQITLSVKTDESNAYFRVIDQGKGIDKSEEKKLFRAFHKSAENAAYSKPGVGLGLALCQQLAKALGGGLEIERTNKRGASFCLNLPLSVKNLT